MKRPRSPEDDFEGDGKRRDGMRRTASRNREAASDRNAANYDSRGRVEDIQLSAGDLAVERSTQCSSKLQGILTRPHVGPRRVFHVVGNAVAFLRGGKQRTLFASSLKKFGIRAPRPASERASDAC